MDNLSDYNPKYCAPPYFSEDEPNFRDEITPEDVAERHLKRHAPKLKGDFDNKREDATNATDFADEILGMMNDDTKRHVVEIKEESEIK